MLFLLAQAGSWLPAMFYHDCDQYDDDRDGHVDDHDDDDDEDVSCDTAVKVMNKLFSWKSQQNFIHSQSANIVSKVGEIKTRLDFCDSLHGSKDFTPRMKLKKIIEFCTSLKGQ